jgi:hypothetical protein
MKQLKSPGSPPKLCTGAADFASEEQVGIRGAVEIQVAGNTVPAELYEDEDEGRNPEIDYFPVALITDLVTVYRADGAEKYLDEVAEMVKDCPKGANGATYRSLGSLGLGDESVLIQGTLPARDGVGELVEGASKVNEYFAEVRIADTVVSVHYGGHNSDGTETVARADAIDITGKAVQRARNWRG